MASMSTGWRRRLFGGVVALFLGFAPGASADTDWPASDLPAVELMLHQRPPYYTIQDAAPGGIVVAPVLTALSESGLRHFWTNVPPTRQLLAIRRSDTPVCGVGWFRTEEREGFARFSRPLYTDHPMVVLSRANDPRTATLDSLAAILADPGLTFGTRTGYAYGTVIDSMLERKRPSTFPSDRDSAGMAALLLVGLFDYMLLADEEIDSVRRALRTDFAQLQVRTFEDTPLGNSRHLMCSQAVPEAWIERLNRALPVTTADAEGDER